MKLLIADDQMSLHTYLDKIIDWQLLGITNVIHAYNGKEAADIARDFLPDLLIIDIRMPELNGIDALRNIQTLPKKPKTVILSAFDEFEYARDALRLSVAHYLLKPVDGQLLIETIRELIREIRSDLQSAVVRELEKAGHTNDFSESCLGVLRGAFATYGIVSYAVSTISGNLPAGLTSELLAWGSDNRIPYSFLLRESNGEYVFLLGMTVEMLHEEWRDWCENKVGAWRALRPEWAVSMGISRIETQLDALPRRMAESINSSKLSFYLPEAVLEYSEPSFAENSHLWAIHELEKTFEQKVRGGYSPESIGSSMNELLDQLRMKRADPDFVYGVCHRLLFIFLHADTGIAPKSPIGS
ncbi:response regulator [Cohnella silvisoli]|uniref:Response regulator n=1 Tax=Cohnella silvisoli TaxID=2873699 RepID=A0ABV1KRJ2_9BACL|nr:response regulator [Cohnella silvisoli]MCD9021739.1 response regulator [Cohnella silvisoli]